MNQQPNDVEAPRIRIAGIDDIAVALDNAGLRRNRSVIVLVGGAGGMDATNLETVAEVLHNAVVPIVEQRDAAVVDGGTDSGVMRLIGRARSAAGGRFPLVGVAAEGTVGDPGAEGTSDAVELEPNHSLFLLVPGTRWGDETRWITEVAAVVAGSQPSVTLLINGGQIAYEDVAESLGSRRPVVVLAGSGRAADAIADARAGSGGDDRAVEIAASPLTKVVEVGDVGAVAVAIRAALDVESMSTPTAGVGRSTPSSSRGRVL
jgi:TRPM family ion channel